MSYKIIEEEIPAGKPDNYLKTYSVRVNPEDHGGSDVVLSVDVFSNDGEGFYHNIFLKTQCYGASAAQIGLFSVDMGLFLHAVKKLHEKVDDDFGEEKK